MKFKHLFSVLFVALIVNFTANAQTKSVDVDNFRFNITYRVMPTKPFDPLFFTYSTRVEATKSTEQRVSLSEVEDRIRIEGQQKVNSDEESFLFASLYLGNLIVKSNSISERKEEDKDKDGKVTAVRYYYSFVVSYSFESSYKVFQGDRELTSSSIHTTLDGQTYKSSEYRSRKEASDYWNNNKDILISEFAAKLSNDAANRVSSQLARSYGFPIARTTDIIQRTDEKKHLENTTFRTVCAGVKEKFEAITPNQGLREEDVADAIEYFKSIPAKYTDQKLKADIKIRYAAYYNLCRIYLYLEDTENVHKYADLLIQNVYDKKDGEKLKKAADELVKELSKTEITTRHFNPEDYFE